MLTILQTSFSRPFLAPVLALCIVAACWTPARADNEWLKRLTIVVTPKYVLSTNGDQSDPTAGAAPTTTTHDLRLDFGAEFELAKRTQLFYDHFNAQFTLGRVYLPTPRGSFALYPGANYDRFETYGIRHDFNRTFQLNAGYFGRSRECCPGDADPNALIHDGYGGEFLGTRINFLNLPKSGPVFTYSAQAIYVSHHPNQAVQNTLAPGVTDPSSRFILPQTLALHIPFPWDRHFHPFIIYERGSDYFNFEAVPEYQNITIVGFARPITNNFVFSSTL